MSGLDPQDEDNMDEDAVEDDGEGPAKAGELKEPVIHKDDTPPDTRVANFEVNRDDFITFLEAARCQGILHVDNDKVKQGLLFSNFLLSVTKNGVFIKGLDTKQNKVIAQHIFRPYNKDTCNKGAVMVSEGDIPVTDVKDLLKALSLCTGGKDDVVVVLYPDSENRIFVGKKGTETGWSFPSKGKREVTSLEKADTINHIWDNKESRVVSTSKQTGQVLKWKHKITALPEELKMVATDMKDFVKQRVVALDIKGGNVVFSLGTVNATRKGKRQLLDISRQVYDEAKKAWVPVGKGDKVDDISANYFHGFYAVLQNIPDANALELHFQKFGAMDMCWIRSFSSFMELNFCIPFEQATAPT